MKLGYAQTAITPSLERPVYLAGFGQSRLAESVHDDLYVRALALADSETTVVLCALDLIGFFQHHVRQVIEQVKREHPQVQIVLASTHTHHGPDTMGIWGPDDRTRGVDERYLTALKRTVVQTISESLAMETRAAAVKTDSVHVPGVTKNLRDADIVDDELTALQLLDAAGKPLITVFSFPCHPEVLWEDNPHITSDYPASLRRTVESETGAPCIFFSGALGGMMSPNVDDHSFEEAEEMGVTLAEAGLDALRQARCDAQFVLQFTRRTFSTRLKNVLFEIAIRRGLFPEPRDCQGLVTTETSLIRIGDCWLVAVPGELLPKLGLAIKQRLRAAGAPVTGIIGLANDELGYILPEEDYRYPLNPLDPKDHYEETMSISKQIGPNLMDAVDGLLKDPGTA